VPESPEDRRLGAGAPGDGRRATWIASAAVAAILALLAYRVWTDAGYLGSIDDPQAWFQRNELRLKLGLCLLCAALVLWPERRRDPGSSRRAPLRLKVAATLAMAAYYNLGAFHGGGLLHMWELFHYGLGSKYFPELGYDGLYAGSAIAQLKTMDHPVQTYLRDLRSNEVVKSKVLAPHMLEIFRRFSRERWVEFVADHAAVSAAIRNNGVRMDHGYNPTPTWTFVARLFDRWRPFTGPTLHFLALLDQVLLALMWVVLFRTYGSRIGCLAMTVFGLSFASRFLWNGGALLRFDWLVATVLGVCWLKRERHGWAGAALAYAAMVRVFPALFVFGLGVRALGGLTRREDGSWARRFAAGFAVSAILCFGAGCLAGRGFHAWPEFARNLKKHRNTWLNNNVGLANLLVYDYPNYNLELVDPSLPDRWTRWAEKMTELKDERRPAFLVLALALLALVAAAAWRAPPDEAAVLGIGVVFTLLLLTCYYWAMLLIAPIRGKEWAAGLLLVTNALLFHFAAQTRTFVHLFGALSWALALLLLVWTLPAVVRALPRTRRAEPSGELPAGPPS
jgi:hypothetical protein